MSETFWTSVVSFGKDDNLDQSTTSEIAKPTSRNGRLKNIKIGIGTWDPQPLQLQPFWSFRPPTVCSFYRLPFQPTQTQPLQLPSNVVLTVIESDWNKSFMKVMFQIRFNKVMHSNERLKQKRKIRSVRQTFR